nr:hypothetical protein [Gluconobacter thailandicus]
MLFGIAAQTGIKKQPECFLVGRIFVDIGNAQLRLPQEGVIRTLENLALLRNRMDDRFQRGTTIGDPECALGYLGNDLLQTTADRPKILDTFVPQKPALIGPCRIVPPAKEIRSRIRSVINPETKITFVSKPDCNSGSRQCG